MKLEIQALEKNHTWILVPLPPGKTPIGNKWVYKIKHKADGAIERYKARLVAKGFNQKEGIDYTETFAPVAKMVTVRTLLNVVVQNDWIIKQLDVNNAFFHGDLHEDVYMQVPQGYTHNLPSNIVCKLTKSLYNLKQANRQWNTTGLAMSQRKYVTELITHVGLLDTKPSTILLYPIVKLTMDRGEPISDLSTCKTLVGKLLYLTITRPDLAFSAQALSQFLQEPTTLHIKTLLKSSTPVPIMCDNISSIALASNHVQHARTKYIEIDCHFVRDKVRQGVIAPTYVSTKHQIADILAKGLPKTLHYNCLSKLGMCNPYTLPTCAGGGGGLM
ncbi:retrovirus-related pol polyprotein from transposon TNT 1-94 [Tanacetum coccineum]